VTLVSVITPTWQRHEVLMDRCVQSVFAQTYPAIEHVVVSDGPDWTVAGLIANDLWRRPLKTRPLRFEMLHTHVEGTVDYGSRARNRGLEVAAGHYVAYLDDDNAYRPEHIATLVAALQDSPDVDFAYSQMVTHPSGNLIGYREPQYGGIDTSLLMHRAGVPQKYGMWPEPHEIAGDKHAPDWGVVERWLTAGAQWVHVPQVTVDYYE